MAEVLTGSHDGRQVGDIVTVTVHSECVLEGLVGANDDVAEDGGEIKSSEEVVERKDVLTGLNDLLPSSLENSICAQGMEFFLGDGLLQNRKEEWLDLGRDLIAGDVLSDVVVQRSVVSDLEELGKANELEAGDVRRRKVLGQRRVWQNAYSSLFDGAELRTRVFDVGKAIRERELERNLAGSDCSTIGRIGGSLEWRGSDACKCAQKSRADEDSVHCSKYRVEISLTEVMMLRYLWCMVTNQSL